MQDWIHLHFPWSGTKRRSILALSPLGLRPSAGASRRAKGLYDEKTGWKNVMKKTWLLTYFSNDSLLRGIIILKLSIKYEFMDIAIYLNIWTLNLTETIFRQSAFLNVEVAFLSCCKPLHSLHSEILDHLRSNANPRSSLVQYW